MVCSHNHGWLCLLAWEEDAAKSSRGSSSEDVKYVLTHISIELALIIRLNLLPCLLSILACREGLIQIYQVNGASWHIGK